MKYKGHTVIPIDMRDIEPSGEGIGKAEIGDTISYHHHQLGHGTSTVVWKSQTNDTVDSIEYQVEGLPVLLWENEVDKVLAKKSTHNCFNNMDNLGYCKICGFNDNI
jgi:hypothetical protein